MKEKCRVSDEIHVSGGFGDVRSQQYMGRRVAVKTAKGLMKDLRGMKVAADALKVKKLEIQKTRKVGINDGSRRLREASTVL